MAERAFPVNLTPGSPSSRLRDPLKQAIGCDAPELGFWRILRWRSSCPHLRRHHHCLGSGIVGWLMPALNFDSMKRWIAIIMASGVLAPLFSSAETIDYHQHLYSLEAGARSSPGPNGIDADYLVAQLDAVGIRRAVVLSVAYSFSNPNNRRFQMNTRT